MFALYVFFPTIGISGQSWAPTVLDLAESIPSPRLIAFNPAKTLGDPS